ncbi:hypothetical protein PACTADRAFT_51969 [Pachysolen tannophilus NRRL Y-2460]|uniref:Probable 26S proteasome regulatory subunit p27 n=1 Tax=Pachysolen tannophilus NRRL Y-2460 TaxID=669874 RepID=A0A1E4TNN6_PACTA|nr:hypothetical protein PACTADRAFT_51969 [Pachysolen tannophilus NRRL Y-2460]
MPRLSSLHQIELDENYDLNSKNHTLDDLIKIKKKIEQNLSNLFDHLEKFNCDMDSELVTIDGFPRSDIDVVQVRLTRSKIIYFRNDLKTLLNMIELCLQEKLSVTSRLTDLAVTDGNTEESTVPFAIVTEVIEESPSYKAGLNKNDKIIKIGSINAGNHDNLKKVAEIVKKNEDKQIELKVIRGNDLINVYLTPTTNWDGNGLLGCRINPL